MNLVLCSRPCIRATLDHLQEGGRRGAECVVLWLANSAGNGDQRVKHIYRPAQWARADIFRIEPQAMRDLMDFLTCEELMIAAQVHSHPREAFHSLADDAWAIVRHEGALSLVVPDFALRTDENSFAAQTKVFRLTADNHWLECDEGERDRCLSFD